MASKFRSKIWDPLLLVSQIVSMQFQFYSSLLLLNFFINKFVNIAHSESDKSFYSLDNIFDHRMINFQNSNNTFLCFTFMINSVIRYFRIYTF